MNAVSKNITVKQWIVAAIMILVSCAGVFFAFQAGNYLVVNHPERSDVIVVLAGDRNDHRYWRGLELLREGYGQQMMVDAMAEVIYGRTYAQHAADFVAQSAGDNKSQITICTIKNDSTVEEVLDVGRCLAQVSPTPHSVLLVTSDFHTRRAISIMRSRLPQYRWSVAAANDPTIYGQPWWHQREWAKTCVYEWEKLVWWKLFESWRH
jgi:uncharacterized SAM-binding protein YcdF (DUF218 family)